MNTEIKILIVDDEPDAVEFLSYSLKREGYIVFGCHEGHEAIRLARIVQPDLILLDIRMPGKNGIEVCRELKTEEEFKHVPVVFLTADSDDYTTINAMSAGGDHFISKPIHPKLIVGVVLELLKQRNRLHVD